MGKVTRLPIQTYRGWKKRWHPYARRCWWDPSGGITGMGRWLEMDIWKQWGWLFSKFKGTKKNMFQTNSGGKSIWYRYLYCIYIYKCIDEIDQIWGNADTISFHEGSFGFFAPCISSCGGANNMVRTAVFWLRGFIVDFMNLFFWFLGFWVWERKGNGRRTRRQDHFIFVLCWETNLPWVFFSHNLLKHRFSQTKKKQYNTHTHTGKETPLGLEDENFSWHVVIGMILAQLQPSA